MGQHAILSASASKRWMNCTPSALLEKQFADEESIYAAEGTAAHALAEHKLKRFLKKRSKRPVSDYDCDEMEECTDDYVSFAMEQIEKAKQSCSDPVVMIEQWMTVHTVWADIAPVSGKEYMASNRETAEITNKIYIRFRSGIKSTMRIKHGDRIFEIESVLGDKRSGMLTIMAREVARWQR